MSEVNARKAAFLQLERLHTQIIAIDKNTLTESELLANRTRVDATWKKVEDNHNILMEACTDEAAMLLQLTVFTPMEDCYMKILTKLNEFQFHIRNPTGSSTPPSTSCKLPRVSLPTFSGNYEEWTSFSDLFTTSIHSNASLSGAQKLQYLKSCVIGEAANLIKTFMITNGNYSEAWSLLEQRYNNERIIIQTHVKRLLFQQSLKSDSVSALQEMLNITRESIRCLKVLGRPVDKWDDLLTVLLVEKFDCETKAEWARTLKGTTPPTWSELESFMEQHIRTLEAKVTTKPVQSKSHQFISSKKIHHVQSSFQSCQFCKGAHQMYQCTKLRDLPTDKRFAAVKATNVCLNCLKSGHFSDKCTSSSTCRKCNRKHNTFIHVDATKPSSGNSISHSSGSGHSSQSTPAVNICTSVFSSDSPKLLKTALVDVLDDNNVKHQVRVFIDEGGEGGLIRESRMNQLGLQKQRCSVTVSGVCETTAFQSKWKTHVRLYSRFNNASIDVELHAVPKVTGKINQLTARSPIQWSHIAGLTLADPFFYEGGEPDILIGADAAPYILLEGLKKSDRNSPVAQETIFGWVLTGNVAKSSSSSIKINNFKCQISDSLEKFWVLEQVPCQKSMTKEEETCENHFQSTHSRQDDGRYVVRLPFNEKKNQLGDSRDQALRRLHALERRFTRQPQYKKAYVEFMKEYENMGHMEKVIISKQSVKTFYLPHHFVLKEDSSTTKQRTVFDGSAKSTSGTSLNDCLLVGATVQPDLFTLLLRFRYNKIALKADIAKMYRQFLIHEDDRDFQRILFREEPWLPVQEYCLTTVTYGTASAPHSATRCLNQLAKDEGSNFPDAAAALLDNTYVDDFLGTADSITAAKSLVQELIGITASAGMEIRKWCTNDPEVLSSIPEQLREQCSVDFDDISSSSSVKALGIKWNPSTDNFMFNVKVNTDGKVTKRFVLSEIAKTFDPLGWLAPVTVKAKLLLQKVWLSGCDWDSELIIELQQEWKQYLRDLVEVENVKIPRCVIEEEPVTLELHGFSDSSEAAFSAAVYLKCIYRGHVTVFLLTARSKVAPLKKLSLPKLELCGATVLSETIEAVQKSLSHIKIPIIVFCWTDSTITLHWIRSMSRKWKTFVANRVSSIQSIVPPENWHHVRSEDNPADLPSRGINTDQLINSSLWWHGPPWLQSDTYPLYQQAADEAEIKKEESSKQLAFFHNKQDTTHSTLFAAFSSLNKLSRCSAYIIRFINFLKSKKKIVDKDGLCISEIIVARNRLIRWAQKSAFQAEFNQLNKDQCVNSSSKLLQLTPFIKNGLLRVGGRIQLAELPEEIKHPVILPHDHNIVKLLINDVHLVNLHSGFTLTNATIRRHYWILRGRDVVRFQLKKCITCRRVRAVTSNQLMGNLPVGRVTVNRPFFHSGVDFAGPFHIKMQKGRRFPVEKVYFAIFVCLATKAVHLEAVTSLSSEAFIACYERFISRRGACAEVYSDCGTNFVGADRLLKEFLKNEQSRIQHQLCNKGTKWNFNPPAAPHQGGLWEAGVKAVKYHFHRVVGQQILCLEQFQTLLCKIEACLNSRPLCALSSDAADIEALTPGHFLVHGPLNAIPEPDTTLIKQNRLGYWELVRQLNQHFWRRWSTEYLNTLQQRFKWTQKRNNLQDGDLVVISDEQLPPTKWKLGRIISTFPGKDGLVRKVALKTATGEITRPITKLCPLILSSEIDE